MVDNPKYGITAVRFAGSRVVGAMMGLIDVAQRRWELRPTETRVTQVVDRLVEGDTVVSVFPGEDGFETGPEVKVDVLPEGTETLAFDDDAPGRSLSDLPRF